MRASDVLRVIRRWIVVPALLLGTAAGAATFDILVDSDDNAASGCAVAVPSGTFPGVEFIVTTTVDTGVYPPVVTGVTRRDCVAPPSTYSSPVVVDAGGWPIGIGGGTAGFDVLETYFQVLSSQGRYRLGFVYNEPSAGSDGVVTVDGQSGSGAIQFSFGPPAAVPTLAHGALVLLAFALVWFALHRLRRHKAPLLVVCGVLAGIVAGTTWAAIVLDGLIVDWTGVPPKATDSIGDAPGGADLAAIFLKFESPRMYVRADVKTASPPGFTSANAVTLIAGNPANFAITTSGNPPVNSISQTGTLPSGVNFVYVAGSNTASLSGTPANGSGSTGPYALDLTGSNGVPPNATQTLTITVTDVNVAPSYTKGANPTVLEDAGAQTVAGWATAISKGGAWESAQTLNFQITGNTNPGLFSAVPAVSPAGTLTYTPAADANGVATITLVLHDDGGTANGGADTSAPQTFDITVTAVNDAPSFVKGADQTVLATAGAQTVSNFITAISPGPANESAQTVTMSVSGNTNAALFSVAPAFTGSGTARNLTYTPSTGNCGSATVTAQAQDSGGVANGGVDTSTQTFVINVSCVNQVPSFTKGADQTVLEDAGAQTVNGWASAISPGPPNESGQTVNFIVSNNNNGLFSVQPAVSPTGALTYTPAANQSGTAVVSVQIHDDGGVANGGVDTSAVQTFNINVTAVNDAPSFNKGADQTVFEDSAAQTVSGWATAISAGPADESGQSLTFSISGNSNPGLFSAGPAISSTGTLTFTPAPNASGSATITVVLTDSGGTANGGVNTSPPQTFAINVTAINDPPSFTKGADQTVLEDAGAQTVNGWAGAISPGPASELGQTVDFIVSNDNNGLFSVQPAVSPTGALTYTPAANQSGTAVVSVQIHDNGGVANGGIDTSAVQTFNINVTAVNDPPTVPAKNYTAQANMPIDISAGAGLLSGASDAADNGVSGCVSTTFTLNTGSISATSPAGGSVSASADGSFRFTPPPGVTGNVTFTYTIADTGCPGPGVNSAPITVTFNVAGPVIWFVDTTAAGGGDGTLLSRFNTLGVATAAMGANTNQRIFVYSGIQALGAGVTLPASGWLVGQGVTGASFDAVMGITPPAGTVARPSIALTHPTVRGTVNMNGSNTAVRGLRIQPPASSMGLVASLAGPFTGLVVSDIPNIATTGARAVDLNNVSGTFTITAVNASGADIGINLANVNPSTGSFSVVGNGGACSSATPTCTGGTVSGATDTGVKLTSAKSVTLTRMRLNGSTNFGLNGSSVTGLSLDTCLFDGTHGGAVDEGALFVTDWLGTGAITNSEILGGFNDNVRVNNTTGTLDRLTVSGTTVRNSGNNHGLALYTCLGGGPGTCSGATMNVTVTGSTFKDNSSNHIDIGSKGLASMDVVLSSNTFQSANSIASQPYGGAVNLSTDHASDLTFDVAGNTSTFSKLTAFNFFISNQTTNAASMTGRFRDNNVGTAGVDSSASVQGGALTVTATGAAALVMNVTGNTLRNWGSNNGVDISAGDGGATGPVVDMTITGNTLSLDNATVNQLHGISANMGTTSTGGAVSACLDIGGAGLANGVVGSASAPSAGFEIRARQRNSSVVRLPGYVGSATDTAAVASYLAGRNTTSGVAFMSSTVNVTGFGGGAACTHAP